MADLNHPCLACEIVAGRVLPPGGVVHREGPFVVHGIAFESPIRGWLVLTTVRHARALYDLDPRELAGVAPLAARVMNAQRAALGAVHAHAFAIGDQLHHFHLHLVPVFAETPEHLRGARIFTAGAAEALPAAQLEDAAAAVRARLASP